MVPEYDVFISYANSDDVPLSESQKGWVSNFRKFLDTMLDQLLGLDVKFATSLDHPEEAERARIFISVISSNSILAPNCSKELDSFLKSSYTHTVKKDVNSRIFKIVKTPVSLDKQHEAIRDILSYDFFQVDPETGRAYEFTDFFNPEAEKNYWVKLVDLAYDVFKILSEMRSSKSYVNPFSQKESVYLAETTHDLISERDIIKRELQRHGYRVLPDHNLPHESGILEATIKKYLQQCKLTIHMIGSSYGEYLPGTEMSMIEMENRISAEYFNKVMADNKSQRDTKEFSRLIWFPVNLKINSEIQKAFIENLRRESIGAEVLQIPLEDLKSVMRVKLASREGEYISGSDPSNTKDESKPQIYIICDQSDMDATQPIAAYLSKKGFEILYSSFEGDLIELRQLHQESLRNCDASLIYCGKATPEWVKAKLQDLMKAPGFGRTKPMLAKAIFTDSPELSGRVEVQNEDAIFISGNGGFSPEQLEPFLTKIQQANE
jgi:hypothetical protein